METWGMGLPFYIVDAFASRAFEGNPAAVCVLDGEREDGLLQKIAGEMNLSETAFLLGRGDGVWGLRWMTPTVEVDLCGHATLAAAHVLWETGRLGKGEAARFATRSGVLTCRLGDGGWVEMDFPAERAVDLGDGPGEELLEALGVVAGKVVGRKRNRMDYLVELETERAVREMVPDFGRLAKLPVRGVIVTARAEEAGVDFVSRFFAPGAGVNEDPVTGSAHCCLGPYWGEKLGKTELVGFQASKRGGRVRVRVEGDRVMLGGEARMVGRGELLV